MWCFIFEANWAYIQKDGNAPYGADQQRLALSRMQWLLDNWGDDSEPEFLQASEQFRDCIGQWFDHQIQEGILNPDDPATRELMERSFGEETIASMSETTVEELQFDVGQLKAHLAEVTQQRDALLRDIDQSSSRTPAKGDRVSIDVSTGDEDAGNRVFGVITGRQSGADGEPCTWLCELDHFNYTDAPRAVPDDRDQAIKGAARRLLDRSFAPSLGECQEAAEALWDEAGWRPPAF
ncbi:MAG: hypothetical protein LAT62_15055 [Natronospirillum sp.]|uniref:hypothetical protein n=1 Tax=Natronospirillum sp. TaxID=2812955 RepID=UPI0025E39917|nr:hypothetical protein [Natronospirillum sp.]MCH8553255.1 hypothetical protein [Natronospirillum sp.]